MLEELYIDKLKEYLSDNFSREYIKILNITNEYMNNEIKDYKEKLSNKLGNSFNINIDELPNLFDNFSL